MPTGISRLGVRGRSEWVASILAAVSRTQQNRPTNQGTILLLYDSHLASSPVSAYTRPMPSNPNKLLAVLLALIVAFVPMGGALAASHACEGGSGGMAAMDHTQHLNGATVTDGNTAGSGYFDSCQSCSGDCCTGSTCSASACGASAALTSVSGVQVNFAHDVFLEDLSDSAITSRQTPPFRPPRV